MKKLFKIFILIIIIAGAFTLAELFFFQNKKLKIQTRNNSSDQQQTQTSIANDTAVPETKPTDNPVSQPASDPPPAKFLLEMPFYSQAPFSNWDKVHEEMCEEASVLNAGLYLLNNKIPQDEFEKDLMAIKKIEEKLFNDYKSTTIAQTKQFTDQYFGNAIKTKIIDNPTIEDIETEVAAGHPVIVPLAGRDIGNPNFTPPGPVYHMLVVKGYDSQNFITNDVGTRKGNSYTYTKNVIMRNMHDWDEKDIHNGLKKVLVLYK